MLTQFLMTFAAARLTTSAACEYLEPACQMIIEEIGTVDTAAKCVAAEAAALTACMPDVGTTPVDPESYVCAAQLSAVFDNTCKTAVASGSFTSDQCVAAAGCSSTEMLATTDVGLYDIPCTFYDDVIAKQFPTGTILTTADCATGEALVATACTDSGLSTALATACSAYLPALFESTCYTSVTTLGAFTAQACTEGIGCPWTDALAVKAPAKLFAFE